jgi:hypothetical protein
MSDRSDILKSVIFMFEVIFFEPHSENINLAIILNFYFRLFFGFRNNEGEFIVFDLSCDRG